MFTLLNSWYQRHFSQPGTIEFALVLIVCFIIVYYFMWLVGPIVVALCFAFCLDWPVIAMQNRFALSRKVGSIIVMLVFSSLLALITIWLVPNVIKQGAEFYNSIVAFSTDDSSHKNKASNHTKENELSEHNKAQSNKDLLFDLQHSSAKLANHNAQENLSSSAHLTDQAPNNKAQAKEEQSKRVASDKSQDAKSETTIVYIAPSNNDENQDHLSDNEKMAKAVASAAMMAAQIEQAKNIEQKHKQDAKTNNIVTKEKLNKEGSDYHITLINGTGSHLSFDDGSDNQFTMSANDFDTRLAKEIHDVVLSMPDPLPSMLTLGLIKDNVRLVRISATNKMADLMRTQFMPSVVNAFTWLVYALIVPIFTFLMLYNKEQLKQRAKTFILPNNQQLMRKFWPSMHAQIAGYIRGKLLHILIIAIANTLAFMLLDMNYALLLGVGVGLSVVIPYVGAVIIAVPVVMVAIFQFGFSSTLIWVLIIYTIIQLLDSNVLTPMLFSKAMNLDAFSILAAILIFGNLWGFWGVFFAIPLATFVKTLIVGWPNAEPCDENGQRI